MGRFDLFQFVKFCVVGVSNTIIYLGIYYMLLWLGCHYLLANVVGFAISVLNAWFWSNKYVFKTTNNNKICVLSKLYMSYGATTSLNTFILYAMVTWFNVPEIIAPLFCLCVTIPLNFLLNKFWVFEEK